VQKKKKKTYIGGIANEFTKENLLVAVEGVDDKTEELVDLRLKGKRLRLRHFGSVLGLDSEGCREDAKDGNRARKRSSVKLSRSAG